MSNDTTIPVTPDVLHRLALQDCNINLGLHNEKHFACKLPPGFTIHQLDMEKMEDQPRRIRESIIFRDATSFNHYCLVFRTEGTMLFESENIISAKLDYHIDPVLRSWSTHTAQLRLELDPAFVTWHSLNGKTIPQADFAELIDLNSTAIENPSAADMLEIAQTLTGLRKVDFTAGIRLANGDTQLKYVENTDAKAGARGDMEVPNTLFLRLPVYLGQLPQTIPMRLYWRISDDGKLTFRLQMVNLATLLELARELVREQIRRALDLPILL